MNANKTKKTIAAAGLACYIAAGAAAASTAAPTSLAEARRTALEKNASVRQAELSLRSAELSERSAKADFLPSVSASASFNAAAQDGSDLETTPSASLSASKTLFSGGTVVNALRTARLRTLQAGEDLRAARLGVIGELDARYLNALKTKRTHETALKDLEASEKRLEIADAKRSAGALAETDFLETQASWATKKTAETQAKWAAEAAARRLDSYLGVRIEPAPLFDADFRSVVSAIEAGAAADLDALVRTLYDRGRSADPLMRRHEASTSIAELAVKTKRAAFLPTISVSASVRASENALGAFTADRSVSVSASVPLFPVSSRAAAVDIAKADLESAASLRRNAEEELLLSFYTTTLDILSAAGRIGSADAALSFAEQNYSLALEKFRLGALSVSGLADAEATLAASRAQTIDSRFELYAAIAGLGRLLGSEDERSIIDALR